MITRIVVSLVMAISSILFFGCGGNVAEEQLFFRNVARNEMKEARRALIRNKNLVNAIDSDNSRTTPLMIAAEAGHSEMVKLLLTNGADCTRKDFVENTSLHYAVENQHHEVLSILIRHLPDGNPNSIKTARKPLLTLAVIRGNEKALDLLLNAGFDPSEFDPSDSFGTALQHAVWKKRHAIAEKLLKRGVDPNQCDTGGTCPLNYAAYLGDSEMCNILVRYGAKTTPFYLAFQGGIPGGPNVGSKDATGSGLLHYAAIRGNADQIKKLLSIGCDPNESNSLGEVSLHMASFFGNSDAVRILIQASKKTVNSTTNGGKIPLHYAVLNNHLGAAKLLLEGGADPNIRFTERQTTLNLACDKMNLEMVRILIRHGASLDAISFRRTDRSYISECSELRVALD